MLVTLCSLCDWSEWSSDLVLLRILNELVLLEEIFECPLFPVHFILENFDFGFQFNILFFVHVGQLFHFDSFIIESFRFLLAKLRWSVDEIAASFPRSCCRVGLLDSAFSLRIFCWNRMHGVGCNLGLVGETTWSFLRWLRGCSLLLIVVETRSIPFLT